MDDDDGGARGGRTTGAIVLGATALGALSAVVVELSVFSVVAVFLASLALPPKGAPGRRLLVAALAVGAIAAAAGMVRFAVAKLPARLAAAGEDAVVDAAVSRLRAVLEAQDKARAAASHDPDGDGVGSALLLGELAGAIPVRGRAPLPQPYLEPRFGRGDVACFEGTCVVVYLATTDGRGSARPGAPFDDELAERRYVAYAWPDAARAGDAVVFLDEHERILVSDGRAPGQGFRGPGRPPPFDAALPAPTLAGPSLDAEGRGQDGGLWRPWKGKRARAGLVGDR